MDLMPIWMTYLIGFCSGLIIGSFLNVVIIRLPQHQSLIRPGSSCPQCRKKICWWDNVPLLSYAFLGGRCRFCKKKISFRYPMIEFLTGLVFLAAFVHSGWSPILVLRDWPFLAILIAVTFIDIEHRIIPDELSLGGLIFGLLTGWTHPELGWIRSILGASLGFSFFYGVAWLYYQWRGHSGLGGGDIKLLAMLGAFLGPEGVFVTVLVSSVFGSVVGLAWGMAMGRKNMMKLSLPYGPFLATGGLFYYFFGDSLWLQFMTPM